MLDVLLESKFTIGILTIMMNIWGRHIVDEVSTNEEEYRRNIIIRRLVIFAMCYIATREIITSIALTAGFVILAMGVSRRGQEGMENPEKKDEIRKRAGIEGSVEQPAYDTTAPQLFSDK
jgi:flagellar biosynthesis component FlhA